jgi:hypothetical protein
MKLKSGNRIIKNMLTDYNQQGKGKHPEKMAGACKGQLKEIIPDYIITPVSSIKSTTFAKSTMN